MTFKVSVFTANHGYKWSTLPEGMSETQLARYGSVITSVYPEGMGAGDYVQGVIYDGNIVALFSAIRAANWDSANRAARYYAVAFIPRERIGLRFISSTFLRRMHSFLFPIERPQKKSRIRGRNLASWKSRLSHRFRRGLVQRTLTFLVWGIS